MYERKSRAASKGHYFELLFGEVSADVKLDFIEEFHLVTMSGICTLSNIKILRNKKAKYPDLSDKCESQLKVRIMLMS